MTALIKKAKNVDRIKRIEVVYSKQVHQSHKGGMWQFGVLKPSQVLFLSDELPPDDGETSGPPLFSKRDS